MSMIITTAGQNAIAQALANGSPITVAEIAFGTEDRFPTGGETALSTEVVRKPVLASGVDDQKTYFDARLDAEDGPYVLYEVGLFDDAGTLLFIGRIEGFNKLVLTDQPVTLDARIHVLTSQFENVVVQIDTSFAFVPADRRVDTGGGLAGGGDLTENRTLTLDIGSLDAIAGVDVDNTADTFAIRDADDGGHKSITTDELAKAVKAAAGFSHTHEIGDVTALQAALDAKAPKASPSFTGNPTAPTQTAGNNTTRLATTAFVQAALSSAGAGLDVQEFTTSGNWAKPVKAKLVLVEVWGAGGGGASGRRDAGIYRYGGGGGGGGGYVERWFAATDLDTTEEVEVGAGGSGGAAATTDNSHGVGGQFGGSSHFGSWSNPDKVTVAGRGFGGLANNATAGAGGGGGSSGSFGGGDADVDNAGEPFVSQPVSGGFGGAPVEGGTGPTGGNSVFGGGGGGASFDNTIETDPVDAGHGGRSYHGSGGGGAGGSLDSSDNLQLGGDGGATRFGEGGQGGGEGASSGIDGAPLYTIDGSGGGGGGGSSHPTGQGGSGTDGKFPGGGGGGGGASPNGHNSGAGGNGGDGYVRITTITG